MNINTIPGTTYVAVSASGLIVASFDTLARAEHWIKERKLRGVSNRLFVQTTSFVELGVRKPERLRLAR